MGFFASPRLWMFLLAVAFIAFAYTAAVLTASDADAFWVAAAGRWMLEHRTIPSADPFAFTTTGLVWQNHEWLADVIFALWERLFGLASLVFWKWSLLVATFTILHRTLARLTGDWLASFAAVLLAAALASPLLDIRPHLYSWLGFVLLLDATLGRPRPARWLPILFLVWANLHAGVTFGLIALVVFG